MKNNVITPMVIYLSGPVAKPCKSKKQAPVNKYGVKVGQIFSCSWGYDQTNVNFFQVVKLCGDSRVRVVEVRPECIETKAYSWASEDRTYKNTLEPLPRVERPTWIEDQERGDLRLLRNWGSESDPDISFGVSSRSSHSAHMCCGETFTEYVSWYA